MRVLIVDDEKPARERLRRLLAVHDDGVIVGEAGCGEDALAQVAAVAPHWPRLWERMRDGRAAFEGLLARVR